MTILVLESLARVAAERMINSVVAGIILTILAWSLLRLVPRLNARTRVAVWLCVLVAIPGLSIAAVFWGNTPNSSISHPARLVVPESWALTIVAAWALLASLALLRVASGLWRIRSLRAGCRPVNFADNAPGVLRTIDQFRPKRPVALLASETARVPMAVGFFRPAVILPQWVLAELSPADVSAILIHEFAHLRRWDDWTNFFQKLVRAIFFFHPSIWWVDRRLALDREIACDDAVLAATSQARDYARCLVDLAEKTLLRRTLAMAQAAVHSVQHISVRISQILDASHPRATRVSKVAMAGVTALAGVCLIALLQSPTLIAFQSNVVGKTELATVRKPVLSAVPESVHRVKAEEATSAKVVPAMLRLRTAKQSSLATTHKANAVARRDVVVPAKFAPRQAQWKVVRAALVHPRAVAPVESIYFVIPDASFDANGEVVWTLSLWRLTVFHPLQMPVEGTISTSI